MSQLSLLAQFGPPVASKKATSAARSGWGITVVTADKDADNASGSVAVTVISASPVTTPVTVMTLPDTDAVTTPSSEVSAVKLSESPSGSSKCALRSHGRGITGIQFQGGNRVQHDWGLVGNRRAEALPGG